MSELAPLIADLALILICAGVMTLLFKKLKQPLVLGYIVAGFIASPHFGLTPSVIDTQSIHVWSDIGVIFLLFALGLEFSFKKIFKVGGPAIIAAMTIIAGMFFLGITVGTAFGWKRMDAIFLGGMIAMSSTTIIYKAFEDMGLLKKQFAGLVMSILILEDILAVVLMVVLSTLGVSNSFEGGELLLSIAKLIFFLILWVVVGIYLIPLFLRKARSLMNDETLLVVALALCFGMVVLAAKTGFSAAFGAFIMGSILAETVEAEHIDKLVKPVKDLFGAIFFVSVGMMVDPAMIVQYIVPILVITLTVLIGQSFFATVGVLLSGQPLKTAMQCGFSLTQIGEFAFIIASLGLSLGVTSNFLYPIVVAVSVITIFLTPYMIRLAEPAYRLVDRILPAKWKAMLDRYANGSAPATSKDSPWRRFIGAVLRNTLIYTIVCVAIVALGFSFLLPLAEKWIPGIWSHVAVAAVLLLVLAPFLHAIVVKSNGNTDFKTLWAQGPSFRAPLIATIVIRIGVALAFVLYIFARLFHFSVVIIIALALAVFVLIVMSRMAGRRSHRIESTFLKNLRSREMREEYLGEKKPEYASKLMSKDLHLVTFDIPAEVDWAGKSLAELDFGKRYGVHVVSILRGRKRINIPKANERIYPQDRIQVFGSDSELEAFGAAITRTAAFAVDETLIDNSEMTLERLLISPTSPFLDKNIIESGIRSHYHCIIAGVETSDGALHAPELHAPLAEGMVLWVVGERKDVDALLAL